MREVARGRLSGGAGRSWVGGEREGGWVVRQNLTMKLNIFRLTPNT